MPVYDVCIYCYGLNVYTYEKSFSIQTVTAHWTSFITVLVSASPCTLYYYFTIKQAFGNLGLLAGYGAKPIGAGLSCNTGPEAPL